MLTRADDWCVRPVRDPLECEGFPHSRYLALGRGLRLDSLLCVCVSLRFQINANESEGSSVNY